MEAKGSQTHVSQFMLVKCKGSCPTPKLKMFESVAEAAKIEEATNIGEVIVKARNKREDNVKRKEMLRKFEQGTSSLMA